MPEFAKNLLRWTFAPAAEHLPLHQVAGSVFLRVALGLMWLHNVAWKVPPQFGNENAGLYKWASQAVEHPVFPPYSWIVEHVVLPHIGVFGWGVLAAETALAAMLLTGAWVRLAALLGIGQSLAIGLSVAYAPHEWPWAYVLMLAGHVALLGSSAGRAFAVDAIRAGVGSRIRLGRTWAAIAAVSGLVALVGSLDDPTGSRGFYLRLADAQMSLGRFNLIGAGALVLLAVLLGVGRRGPSLAAAALALLSALSLTAQIGFSGPWLGGNATSAAFFLAIAVVAAAVAGPKVHVSGWKAQFS